MQSGRGLGDLARRCQFSRRGWLDKIALLLSSWCACGLFWPGVEHDPTILSVLQVEILVAHLRNGAGPRGKDRSGAQPIRPNPSLALITSVTGGPVRYRSLRRSFDAACRRLGLEEVTPHSLRESCASWVAESDGVLEAARRLGHARSSVTTRHYARPMTGGGRAVADGLDRARLAAREPAIPSVGLTDVARVWHATVKDPVSSPPPTRPGPLTCDDAPEGAVAQLVRAEDS